MTRIRDAVGIRGNQFRRFGILPRVRFDAGEYWPTRRLRFLNRGDEFQMLLQNRNGFVGEAFDIGIFRFGGFGFECLNRLFVTVKHSGNVSFVKFL